LNDFVNIAEKNMEQFGYCHLTQVPLRAAASHSSEMVSQLLFGELFEILGNSRDFVQIRCWLDKYEGFISNKQFLPVSRNDFELLVSSPRQFPVEPVSTIQETNSNHSFYILTGSNLSGFKNGFLKLGNVQYSYKHPVGQPKKPISSDEIVRIAMLFLNAPYLWGGRSLFGIDCSGLVQMVFNINGITLQRDSAYQAQTGRTIHLLSEATPGDLAFFDNKDGQITHVGIVLAGNKIIHSSGRVRIDNLDHYGVYDRQKGIYTHKLRLIKRIID